MQSLGWNDSCSVTSAARLPLRARLGGAEHCKEKARGERSKHSVGQDLPAQGGPSREAVLSQAESRPPGPRNNCVFLPEEG